MKFIFKNISQILIVVFGLTTYSAIEALAMEADIDTSGIETSVLPNEKFRIKVHAPGILYDQCYMTVDEKSFKLSDNKNRARPFLVRSRDLNEPGLVSVFTVEKQPLGYLIQCDEPKSYLNAKLISIETGNNLLMDSKEFFESEVSGSSYFKLKLHSTEEPAKVKFWVKNKKYNFFMVLRGGGGAPLCC